MKTYTGAMNGNTQSQHSSGMLSNQSSFNSFESATDLILQNEFQNDQQQSQATNLDSRHSASDSLRAFYEQFGNFMKWIRNIQNGESLPSNYQRALEENINMDIKELEFLYKEVRASVNNVECLRKQRKAIKKEKNSLEMILKNIEYEENQELEKVVIAHDRAMFLKWQSMKTSSDLTMVDNLLEEAEGKYQAMKNLKLLLTRRKNEITLLPSSAHTRTSKPKYARKLDSFLAARETRRKRARTRAANIVDEVINSGAGMIAIRDSLEAVDQSDMVPDIRIALNTLFGSRTTASVVRQESGNNSTAANKSTTADNELRSSDIQLVLTPILNDYVPRTDKT